MHSRQQWSLEDLDLVRAIAQAGTLAGASRQLGIDHSSAFRRLAAIEQRMEVTLFRRSRRGYVLTEAGEIVTAAAHRILAETDTLARHLSGHDRRLQGLLRVTVPDTLVELALQLITRFNAQHPKVSIDLIVSNAFFSMERRDADVALRASAAAPEGMSVRPLAEIGTAIYGATAHAPAQEKFIGFGEALSHLGSARWLRSHVDADRIALNVDTLPAALAACQAGMGLALLPCYFADGKPGIARVGEVLPDVDTQLWCVIHPDLRRSARVRAFRDIATQWARENADRLSGLADA